MGGGTQTKALSKRNQHLQAARAGRRAGRHVAITEPAGSSAQRDEPTSEASSQQQLQPHLQKQLSGQQDRQQQHQQQQDYSQQERQRQPQPPPQQQQQQQQQQGPPAKRVGFDLQAGAPGTDEDEAGGSRQRFAGVSRRKQEQLQRQEIVEAKQRSKYDERAVEGVVDIPELEEEGKEDITRMVAQAPRAAAPRVQAMAELDQGWLPSKAEAGDIDLSLLTACLLPSEQVVEPPEVWDYDLLFSQLKAELQKEGAAGEASRDAEELRQI
ncbi:hypothetical protein OEZ85_003976 [Tetradesmus obliquus]|uniref:Intraflagellar transport protein 43 n=1 Tax=Tetradesmus obliquus TaxID=3088 RepID=A0ABY8UDA2_TETOB|nr:hypothetical protein OEZ85_003976 [Tetradesmus obliquus]